MLREPVASSQIYSIGYDPNTQTLEVEFKSGGVYQYSNVPPELHEQLMMASSKGSFHATEIKRYPDQYPYMRIA